MRSESKFRFRRIAAIGLVFVLVAGGTAFTFRSEIRSAFEQIIGNDYKGSGTTEVDFVIAEGETGEDVANNLVAAGITKNFRLTYKLILERNQVFYPGTYRLKLEMPAIAALSALSDPNSQVTNRVTIREGLRIQQVFAALSDATGLAVEDFSGAASDLSKFDLPKEAPSLEGYLFPATYSFSPGTSALDILLTLRERMDEEIQKFGIAPEKIHEVLTLASIVQKEARLEDDFYRASRVFLNRIDQGMKLQSDATVSYGVNGTTVATTDAERNADNGYNTYKYFGLPIGPISAPGSVAIDAALNPADGTWLYFCTVNLETGETRFSTTYAEHQIAVREWLNWMKENPGYE